MALDTGKKKIQLQNTNTSVPYIKTESKGKLIADAFKPAIDQLEKNAIAVDQASWYNSFIEDTEAQYLKFSTDFKNDPNGISKATKTYTDGVLQNVPTAYKLQASSILAHKNSTSIAKASNDYVNIKNDKTLAGNIKNFDATEQIISNKYSTIYENPTDDAATKIAKINLETTNNSVALINNNTHQSQKLVEAGLLSQVNHDKYFIKSIENFAENRLLAVMQSFDSEDEAFNYLQTWLNGTDTYEVKDKSNVVMQEYDNHYKSIDNRNETFKNVFNKFNNIRGKKINDLNKDKTFNFEGATERGGLFHFSNFAYGNNRNKALYIGENAQGIKSTDIKKLDKHLTETYLIQDKAALAMRDQVVTGLNKNQKEKMFEMIMYEHNIFDSKEILNVNHEQFMKMKKIFKMQGQVPNVWKTFLNTPTGDLKEPAVMANFKKKLDLYNEIKNDFGINQLDGTNDFLKHASKFQYEEADLITAQTTWNTKDNKAISEYVDNIVSQDVSKFMFEISEALDGNPDIINDIFQPFRNSVSRDLSVSTIFGDGNKYSKVLYPDSFTFFAQSPKELFEKYPEVEAEFAEHVKNFIKVNASNSTFNMYDDKNSVITSATFEALNTMLKNNWGPSKYTDADGKYHLTKNSIEQEFGVDGTALIADAIPHINAWYDGLSPELKKSALGFKETGEPWTLKEITNVIMDTDSNIIFKATNHTVGGKVGYKVSIKNPDGKLIRITDGDAIWQPDGWDQKINTDAPATNGQLVEWLALDRKNFIDKWLGPAKPNDPWYEKVTKKASHGVEKMKIRMGDWSWMIDFPFADDIPHEWKPFKMLFDIAQNVPNLTEKKTELEIQSKKEFDKLNYAEKINLNSEIPSAAKSAEALFAPHEMPIRNYNDQSSFIHFVTTNYKDTSLPLTFRTNNYMAVKKIEGKWDGALDLKNDGNTAAVFAHPADSIRAGVIVMMNMSTIVGTNVTKKYGDVPTIEQILTNYAEDSTSYLKAAKAAGFDINEGVNFQDQDQMHELIKFMVKHEMGDKAFDKYYPKGNLILDAYIQQGYRNGLNHFADKLAKVQ